MLLLLQVNSGAAVGMYHHVLKAHASLGQPGLEPHTSSVPESVV